MSPTCTEVTKLSRPTCTDPSSSLSPLVPILQLRKYFDDIFGALVEVNQAI